MKKTKIIETNLGKVQGYVQEGINIFKGIPYAESPIGNLRYTPPKEKDPWNDVLIAGNFGPSSFQGPGRDRGLFGKLTDQNEDNCLSLNIWTPETDDKNRPVMVWIHGGGFIYSGSSKPIYDGTILSDRGNIVVVTFNYRLGIFGFLYMPNITANVGLLDQVAALKWVKQNIADFGGNPENITIFGESAGAVSVITLMGMPLTKGMFQHAIAQSLYLFETEPPIKTTTNIMNRLGLEIDDIESLRKIPAQKLNQIQNEFLAEVPITSQESYYSNFRPCIDNQTITIHPLEALHKGEAKHVDLIAGSNQNEAAFFTYFDPKFQDLDEKGLKHQISIDLNRLNLGDKTDHFIEQYKNVIQNFQSMNNTINIYNTIYTDFYYRIPAIRAIEAQRSHNSNVYSYLFNWNSPMFKSACHSLDLPFTFGYFNHDLEEFVGSLDEASIVSNKMMDAWIRFAYSGNPNHNNIPEWLSYDLNRRSTMIIDAKYELVHDPDEATRNLWTGIYNY